MYNPILDLSVGDSIYSTQLESEIVIDRILSRQDSSVLVTIVGYTDFNCKYRLDYCYSSLSDGPHWMIDPVDYQLPENYSMDQYWMITNKIFEIAEYY